MYVPFSPKALILKEKHDSVGLSLAISFYVFFVKLAITKCGLPLLVYFTFAITLLAEK